jgi:iron complex transport system substrate-binding protein
LTTTNAALALVLGTTLVACRFDRAPAGGTAVRVVDDAGDTVRLAAPAQRIVSLIPTTTEILLAAGLGKRVVGRTEWCDWPAEVVAIPSVGGGFPPNVEAVVERDPDLVVAYQTEATAPAAAQLRSLGVPVVRLRTDRVADIARAARVLGTLVDASDRMDVLVRDFERSLAAASTEPSAGAVTGPVLLLAWADPAIALGAGAFMSELLELAGGRNAFGDVRSSSAPVSLESIAARDPELVFLADSAAAPLLARPEWRAVGAVRAGRVRTPLAPSLTRAGLRAPLAVRQLRASLTFNHPKARP